MSKGTEVRVSLYTEVNWPKCTELCGRLGMEIIDS